MGKRTFIVVVIVVAVLAALIVAMHSPGAASHLLRSLHGR